MNKTASLLLFLPALAACSGTEPDLPDAADDAGVVAAPPAPASQPLAPATSKSEQPSPPPRGVADEGQAAAEVVRSYFEAIEAGDYAAAWSLRWKGEGDDGASRQAFIDSFARYAEHHATIGTPGPVEGAAGSLYAEVPVQLYGRLKSGEPFSSAGTVTLRRVNDVPGSTAEQRRWRIYSRD